MSNQITNIAGYQFIQIDDVESIHNQLQSVCAKTHLKGSIFISAEGINVSLAGSQTDIEFVLDNLRSRCGFTQLLINISYSNEIPFKCLVIKIRDELVPTGKSKPITQTSSSSNYISSEELKQWLDSGQNFTLLDMRNTFEFELGSFDKAKHLDLKRFRQLQNIKEELEQIPKNKPIVTFCTGGIRCEKAAPFVKNQGFDVVYQLKGGILDYLSKFKGQHWHGDCFVFDERVSLDKDLNPSHTQLCRSCQTILQKDEDQFCSLCDGLT